MKVMKKQYLMLLALMAMNCVLCIWLLKGSELPATQRETECNTVVARPFDGVRLSATEMSNAIIRAHQGSITDALRLALHYGIVCKDRKSEVNFLMMAASNGSAEAAYSLGQLFLYDQNMTNPATAQYWYESAARLGDERAQEKLNSINNSGVTNKTKRAFQGGVSRGQP